jgi:hypothetical protein
MNLSLYDTHAIGELRRLQDRYRYESREWTLDDWNNLPRTKRLAINVAKFFSPLL